MSSVDDVVASVDRWRSDGDAILRKLHDRTTAVLSELARLDEGTAALMSELGVPKSSVGFTIDMSNLPTVKLVIEFVSGPEHASVIKAVRDVLQR